VQMNFLLILLSSALMVQTPTPKPATPPAATRGTNRGAAPKPATPAPAAAPKPAASTTKPKVAAPAATAPVMTTDEQKAIYAVGLSVYRSLRPFALSAAELELLKKGISDAAAGKPAEKLEEFESKIDELIRSRAAAVVAQEKAAAKTYLEKAAVAAGAVKTASGLIYREATAGTGALPKASDTVKVHYRGTLIDGTEFDSSYKRNQPATFPLAGVIRCWTEGVQLMKVGGKATLACPSDTAYGDGGRPGIPGGATLIFEIELLEIQAPN
jgi:FKBP-type peptidyl-prolyl cis-trans isomerase FkpA